jgi:hypothetical protein
MTVLELGAAGAGLFDDTGTTTVSVVPRVPVKAKNPIMAMTATTSKTTSTEVIERLSALSSE